MECCFEHQEEANNKREGHHAVASLERIKMVKVISRKFENKTNPEKM